MEYFDSVRGKQKCHKWPISQLSLGHGENPLKWSQN